MTTPMTLNVKLLSVSSPDMVDAMMYCQVICYLSYLTETIPDTCFAVNTLRHVHLMVTKGTFKYGLKYDTNQ